MRNATDWPTTLCAKSYNRRAYRLNRKTCSNYRAEASAESSGTDAAADFRTELNGYWTVRISRSTRTRVDAEQSQVNEQRGNNKPAVY